MQNSTRIVVNTLAQYFRTATNVILSLYATRLVLEALGSNQYGIYTLVGGIVSMLTFFTNALTSTTQRYLSYNSVLNDSTIQKGYFFNSVIIHIVFGGLLLGCLFGVQPFLFDGFLNIDSAYLTDAKLVYATIAAMLIIAMLTSPYRAVLVSRENIVYLSFVDILDGVFKLLIAILLFYIDNDRLVWYATLTMLISLFNFIAIGLFAIIKYPESKVFNFKLIDKKKITDLTSFAGWTIYGTLCLFGRVQGVAIVINKFLSTVANASYGIALQVNAALSSVSGALQTALAPQLIKSEGESNRERMLKLSQTGCKISFFLLSLIGIPLIFNMNSILELWLGKLPLYSGFFCIILILSNLADQLTVGFNSSINAVGKIRKYHLTVNTLKFITPFVIALSLWLGCSIFFSFSIYLIIETFSSFIRLTQCKSLCGLNLKVYFKRVIIRLILPTIILCSLYFIGSVIHFSVWIFLIEFIAFSSVYIIIFYKNGLCPDEKQTVQSLIKRIKK